jgi:ferredoxin
MRLIYQIAKIDADKCIRCHICEFICPVVAITFKDREPVIDDRKCMGCGLCASRCPTSAINLIQAKEIRIVKVDMENIDKNKVREICLKAKFNPEQIICLCTHTRAKEVVAAILNGAKTPEEVSLMTGVRTGCGIQCIMPILKLLVAAGIELKRSRGWQWYGLTPTIWDITNDIKAKYSKLGYYFDKDMELLKKIIEGKPDGRTNTSSTT